MNDLSYIEIDATLTARTVGVLKGILEAALMCYSTDVRDEQVRKELQAFECLCHAQLTKARATVPDRSDEEWLDG